MLLFLKNNIALYIKKCSFIIGIITEQQTSNETYLPNDKAAYHDEDQRS